MGSLLYGHNLLYVSRCPAHPGDTQVEGIHVHVLIHGQIQLAIHPLTEAKQLIENRCHMVGS